MDADFKFHAQFLGTFRALSHFYKTNKSQNALNYYSAKKLAEVCTLTSSF